MRHVVGHLSLGSHRTAFRLSRSGLLVLACIGLIGCAGGVERNAPATELPTAGAGTAPTGAADLDGLPEAQRAGAEAYARYCAECHGLSGEGTDKGPPHVHRIYEPNHHPDVAFANAARIGVQAHHWDFGDMQPVEGVSDAELDALIGYVRWLQRQAGIQ